MDPDGKTQKVEALFVVDREGKLVTEERSSSSNVLSLGHTTIPTGQQPLGSRSTADKGENGGKHEMFADVE